MKTDDAVVLVVAAVAAWFFVKNIGTAQAATRSSGTGLRFSAVNPQAPAAGAAAAYRSIVDPWPDLLSGSTVTGASEYPDLLATDFNAPGNTTYAAPPPGFVWDETRGGYVDRDANGLVRGTYT